MSDFMLIIVAVLLPAIPASLLYWKLPSKASVKGPFKGLNIALQGAFAGYFLLVITVFGFFALRPKPPNFRYDVWEVRGKIAWNQNGGAINPGQLQLTLVPANQKVLGDGSFVMQVAPEVNGERLKFPTLVIEHPDFQTVSVDLNVNADRTSFGQQVKDVFVDNGAKEIAVKEAINLERKIQLPPYSDTIPPPPQAALNPQEIRK